MHHGRAMPPKRRPRSALLPQSRASDRVSSGCAPGNALSRAPFEAALRPAICLRRRAGSVPFHTVTRFPHACAEPERWPRPDERDGWLKRTRSFQASRGVTPRPCSSSPRRRTQSTRSSATSRRSIGSSQTQPDVERFVRSPVFTAEEQLKALVAHPRQGRHRRPRRQFPQARRLQAPAVRGPRHDRAPIGALVDQAKRHRTRAEVTVAEPPSDTGARRHQGGAQGRGRQERRGRRQGRSRRSSAASSSRSAAAWSTPRSAPSSTAFELAMKEVG